MATVGRCAARRSDSDVMFSQLRQVASPGAMSDICGFLVDTENTDNRHTVRNNQEFPMVICKTELCRTQWNNI